jgi:hypothetical protein
MNKNGMFRTIFIGVALFSLLTLLTACGGGGDSGGVAGTTGTITLETSASSIPADGTSSVIIKATIKDSAGNPVRHYTSVTFTTNLGRFMNGSTSFTMQTQPPLDEKGWPDTKADPTGIAEATFMAGYSSGVAKITASSIGVTQSIYVTVTGGSAGITLTADPTSIPADGKSSTTITATLTDSTGNPVNPGTQVTFTTGLGHFLSDAKSYTVSTQDNTGIVKVSLHAGDVPGTTYVVAASNQISQAIQLVFTNTGASSMTISANPSVIPADGVSTSLVTAKVVDFAGNGIKDVPLTFYDLTGTEPSDPLPPDNTYTTGIPKKDDPYGTLITSVFYNNGGPIKFTMTDDGPSRFTVLLYRKITQSPDDDILVSVILDEVGPLVGVEKTVSSAIVPIGSYRLGIRSGGNWSVKVEGAISPTPTEAKIVSITQTDSTGEAEYTHKSTLKAGIVTLMAETGQASNSQSQEALSEEVSITQIGLAPAAIDVQAAPPHIYANGSDQSTIRATVTDANGNYVADGTVVSFSATLGNIQATASTVNGIASVPLTSIASPTSVISTVTASVAGISDSTQVMFIGVSLTDMKAEPAIIFANGTDTATISVRIRDAVGAAVDGETVSFIVSSGGGTLSPWYAVTNSQGIATVQIIAPTTAGTSLVTAFYGLISASTSVTFTSQPTVGSMTLTADPTTIPANGTSTSKITANLRDTANAPVPVGTPVTFTTTLGKFSNGAQTYTTITPDASGSVWVSLISATTAGSALVTATSNGVTQSVYVGFGGAPVKIVLTANPAEIWADGVSSSAIQATVTDAGGAPVTPGTAIAFTTNLGKFANGLQTYTVPTPDNTGVVTVSLIAGTTTGTAMVSASSSGVAQSVYVEFIQKGGDPFSMTLSANPTTLPADGTSSSLITATLKDSAGNPVKPGTSVTFSTSLGKFSNGQKIITVSTPDATGVVSVSLMAGTTSGSAVVTATSDGVTQTVYVTFTGAVVATINVTATPDTLLADGVSTSDIRAEVRDGQGNPIADGEVITFTIISGTGTLSAASATTSGGFASVTYTASNTPGTVVIQAMSSNNISDTVNITLISSGVGTITLSASPSSLPADGASSSAVTAIVRDGAGDPVTKGTSVLFRTTLGTFSNGTDSITVATLADTGIATVSLIAAAAPGTATVTAESGGVSQTTTVTFIGGGQPASLSLNSSKKSVKSDNSDSATITATLLDGNNAPIAGFVVAFSVDTGQISASSATTDANGQAKITFSAGINSTNRTATITATVAGPAGPITASIPIEILGSSLTLTTDKTTIPDDGSVAATLTATIKDGGGSPVEGALITFTVSSSGTGGANVTPDSGTTNAAGILQVSVKGTSQGDVTVTADWDGTTAAQQYNVTAAADTFAIVLPATSPFTAETRTTLAITPDKTTIAFVDSNPDTITRSDGGDFTLDGYLPDDIIMVGGSASNDGVYKLAAVAAGTLTLAGTDSLAPELAGESVTITNGVLVRVRAPDPIDTVVFSTTIGVWDGGTSAIVPETVPPLSDYVWAVLTSSFAGTATVQVYDEANPSTSDKTTVVFSVPSGNAAQLSLQSNVYTVAPSIGGTKNTATLTATVRTSLAEGSQVVSGVAVAFSIVNPTGGGEYVDPVVAITDAAGQAKAEFTSGSLSSGAEGVTITAYVVNSIPLISDSVAIVIGGIAGSVVIGRGTVIYDLDDATYRLPMAALVTDSNGNAVSGAVVTLSAWPLQYAPGVWYDTDPDPQAERYAVYYTGNFINNEDVNENLILDPGEDKDGDGRLTPASSSAGGVPVPSQVVTDANGVAAFDLIYLKANAMWIKSRIRARTFVVGTETTSSVEMVLPPEKVQAETGLLPDSPFPIGLIANTTQTIPVATPSYSFPKFQGTGDEFKTSSNLSAGESYMGAPIDDYDYTYDPTGGIPAALGDIVWDYIQVKNGFLAAYFPVRIIIIAP